MAREGRDPQDQPGVELPLGGLLGSYWESSKPIAPENLTFDSKKDKNYWEPNGRGFYVDPQLKFKANEKNAASLILTDDPVAGGVGGSTKYIFVKEVSIGMGLNYGSGQGVTGKTFYPRDVIYKKATVLGQTTSQYEYDLLVKWVLRSHRAALYKSTNTVKFSMTGRTAITINEKNQQKVVARTNAINFSGIIESIKAGHDRETFAPEFELSFVLLSYANDYDLSGTTEQSGIETQKKFANHLSLTVLDDSLADVDGNYVSDTANFAPDTGFFLDGVKGPNG